MTKTKSWKLATLFLTMVCALFSCMGCWFQKRVELKEVQAPVLSAVYNDEFHFYDIYVEGIVENPAEYSITGNLTVVLYDAEENVLEVAYAYVGEVGAGERWRYCATTTSMIQPVSCRISEAYGYRYY